MKDFFLNLWSKTKELWSKTKEAFAQKKWLKWVALGVAVVIVGGIVLGAFVMCKPNSGDKEEKPYEITKRVRTGWKDEKEYTWNDYTSQMPDVWNTILTSDATNVDMAGYVNSAFFEFDYQLDENGEIVPGGFTVDYSAATALTDVTADYVGEYGITEAMAAEGHHAFAITLRHDLKWDNGDPIKAEDFVYTMSQQLSPKYLFDTANNYYGGNYTIHNAQSYLKQGQELVNEAAVNVYGADIADWSDKNLYFNAENVEAFNSIFGTADMTQLESFKSYFQVGDVNVWDKLVGYAGENRTPLTQDIFNDLKSLFSTGAPLAQYWIWGDVEIGYFTVVDHTYPAMDFDEVGFFVDPEDEYTFVIVFDNTLNPIDAEGNLTYEAAYYLQDMPLVKRDVWEACEDQTKTPWINTYCTSVETSASWGPYKVTNYQADVTYTVSRNTNWYGYGMEEYADQFQTDKIVCNKVSEWSTAWQMFQKGQVDGIGMDPTIAEQYRNSRQAYFTPDTYTFCLNLQSRATNEEKNNVMLNYESFRKAISLMLDRDDYCAKNSPSSLAALGLLNDMYYYDVPNGKIYRESVQAKEAILNAYGATKTEAGWKVGTTNYTDIDDALDAVTGYNVSLARELMTQAYNEAKADGKYADGEEIVLTYGAEQQTANTDRVKNWFQAAFDAATKGTPLEGKIKIEYYFFSSATWSQDFADGKYDLCFGAWGSAAFNPYYLLCATQIEEANRYALGWDPADVSLTITLQGDDTHEGGDYTFNLEQWSENIQGKEGCILNCSLYPTDDKLAILGAIETAVLNAYYSVPVYSRYSASLMTYKCDYNSYEYNTFMGYGGMRYMTYHFDDAEWAAFVESKGGTLNYLFGRDD